MNWKASNMVKLQMLPDINSTVFNKIDYIALVLFKNFSIHDQVSND